MSRHVMVEALSSIYSANWYALIVDEATDICNKEQRCAIIRWVDNDFNIFEDPIESIDVPKTDSETLTMQQLPLANCRGQGI